MKNEKYQIIILLGVVGLTIHVGIKYVCNYTMHVWTLNMYCIKDKYNCSVVK